LENLQPCRQMSETGNDSYMISPEPRKVEWWRIRWETNQIDTVFWFWRGSSVDIIPHVASTHVTHTRWAHIAHLASIFKEWTISTQSTDVQYHAWCSMSQAP
jgi:hypothetical protein